MFGSGIAFTGLGSGIDTASLVDHRRHAEPFAAHLEEPCAQHGVRAHGGQRVAAMHDILDVQQQTPSQRPAGMRAREVLLR